MIKQTAISQALLKADLECRKQNAALLKAQARMINAEAQRVENQNKISSKYLIRK